MDWRSNRFLGRGFHLSGHPRQPHYRRVIDKAKEWQNRPLKPVCTIVFMDALFLTLRVYVLLLPLAQDLTSSAFMPLKRCRHVEIVCSRTP